jgi:hypothetical protein
MPNMTRTIHHLLLCALALLFAGACSAQGASNTPAGAVEAYLQALAGRDENRLIGLSCAEWEAQARQEFNSFSAVSLQLDALACSQSGQESAFTLVECTGKIIANYGAEDLEIDVAEQTYRVTEEGGEWRVCGYQQR